MKDPILISLLAMLVLGAIWQLTFFTTRSTIAAFTVTTVSLGFIVFQLLSQAVSIPLAYFSASGVFFHAWGIAWLANECIPAVRRFLKAEDDARLSTLIDQNTEGGG